LNLLKFLFYLDSDCCHWHGTQLLVLKLEGSRGCREQNFPSAITHLLIFIPPYSVMNLDFLTKFFRNFFLSPGKRPELDSGSGSETRFNDHHAFRTIITMLSFIQSDNRSAAHTITGPIATAKENRDELKVLDALTTLLIRGDEVVAVVAKPHEGSAWIDQVIASVTHPSNTESTFQTKEDNGPFWSHFSIIPNSRKDKIHRQNDSLINPTSFPLIRDHSIPAQLITAHSARGTPNGPRLLKVFLEAEW
jgi:hypothetical protein